MADDVVIVGAPREAALRQIGEDILDELRAAAVKALAHSGDPGAFPLPSERTALEHLFLSRFRAKPADRRRQAIQRALEQVPPAAGGPGGGQTVDFRSAVPVADQLRARRPQRKLDPATLGEPARAPQAGAPDTARRGLAAQPDGELDPRAGSEQLLRAVASGLRLEGLDASNLTALKDVKLVKAAPQVVLKPPRPKPDIPLDLPGPYRALRLRLHRMRCVEETDGPGSDEIQLAGIATAPSGVTHKIGPFAVSHDFDSGEYVEFGLKVDVSTLPPTVVDTGPEPFATFEYEDDVVLVPGKGHVMIGWPRRYTVTFLLAEIDNGGFPAFVNQIYDQVSAQAAKAIAAAVGAWVGGVAGSVIPGIGTAVGAVVGAVVGWILGELWEWLTGVWEDDEFVPLTVATTRSHQFHRFVDNTSEDSTNKVVWWKGHGGHYRLMFDWLVIE